MRILFVSHTYLRWMGDRAGAQVWRLAVAAQEAGHTVLVVAPHAPGAAIDEVLGGVEVRRFRYAPDTLERIGYQGAVQKSAGSPIALALMPWYLARFRRAVRQCVRGFHPDVIHAHWWIPAAIAAVGQGVPFVVTGHGSDVRLLGRSVALRALAHQVLRRAAAVTAISGIMAEDICRWARIPVVQVTPSAVDETRFHPMPQAPVDPPRILFAGNWIRAKGVDLILEAFAQIRRRGISARLRLVGDGPGQAEFRALADRLGVAPDVEWAGTRAHEEMPGEFAAAAVVVMASRGPRGEGLPITLVEAMMSGCAVVATPAGGIPEIVIDGDTGLIARDGDASHLADQIARLLLDPALRDRLASAGRARATGRFARGPAFAKVLGILAQAASPP
ncbi:MAG TPA: glycosyltransferase [Gemmatimonadales bacterium]|nr:glycosyltransferase [Gemmatimonadales bacterium]